MDVREYTRYLLERKAIQVTHKIETIAYIALLLCCIEFLAMFDLSKSCVYTVGLQPKTLKYYMISRIIGDFW